MMVMVRPMKTYPTVPPLGFLDVELRVSWLEAKGNPLTWFDAVIDREGSYPWISQLRTFTLF